MSKKKKLCFLETVGWQWTQRGPVPFQFLYLNQPGEEHLMWRCCTYFSAPGRCGRPVWAKQSSERHSQRWLIRPPPQLLVKSSKAATHLCHHRLRQHAADSTDNPAEDAVDATVANQNTPWWRWRHVLPACSLQFVASANGVSCECYCMCTLGYDDSQHASLHTHCNYTHDWSNAPPTRCLTQSLEHTNAG